jgi:hypothetical protein
MRPDLDKTGAFEHVQNVHRSLLVPAAYEGFEESQRSPNMHHVTRLVVGQRNRFGNSRAPASKKPLLQVHQVHSVFAFMSLGYELVVFDKFIMFIKFMLEPRVAKVNTPSGAKYLRDKYTKYTQRLLS